MKNVIIGFATNIDEASIRVFCHSARRVYDKSACDIVIVTNKFMPYFGELAKIGVYFVPTQNIYTSKRSMRSKIVKRTLLLLCRFAYLRFKRTTLSELYPVMLETWHHPHFVRWFAYSNFLSLNRGYSQVMLSDVKDVVFQAPFFDFSDSNTVSLCDQGVKYGEAYWDTKWYRDAYGAKELKRIEGRSPLCIGTMMGPQSAVLQLVQELQDEFLARPFGRIEQAVFNRMLIQGAIKTPYRVIPNITGPIVTLCSGGAIDNFEVRDGVIREVRTGRVVPVVHMYDRYEMTREAVLRNYLDT